MSALAKWFKNQGCKVSGYDRTSTPLTRELESSGIEIHYKDSLDMVPEEVISSSNDTLIVYTPAIPIDHKEFNYFKDQEYTIKKRSQVLGEITSDVYSVAVAGTHGKTTTSSMIAHLLRFGGKNVTAFLGGIATNYNTNYLEGDLSTPDAICVVEADEYDRSFLQLHPDYAVVTAMDADHLDIYGEKESLTKSFLDFMLLVPEKGTRLLNNKLAKISNALSYGLDHGNAFASNIRVSEGAFIFDFQSGDTIIKDLILNQPGNHNVENAVAAIQVCLHFDISTELIKKGLSEYKGVRRRFEYIIRTEKLVYVDDYAHHPVEIEAFLGSLKMLYPSKKLTAIFQPHLFTRTRDFVDGFAQSLSQADEVLLLDIYPAREKPIPGVTSEIIFDKVSAQKKMATKESLMTYLDKNELEVLATIGAGDIDTLVEPIKQKLEQV